jgi:murein DD-endopeptidase MepM/ murein hydrolase activator NlpD
VRWTLITTALAVPLLAGCGGATHVRPSVATAARATVALRTENVARPSACATRPPLPYDYAWPIRPFDVQHPIRANFGDPRTDSAERLGLDDSGDPGDYSFHNGVDISAPPGTPVYPVVSGIADLRHKDEVLVHVPGGLRSFQYWHINPRVRNGEHVVAYQTILGTVKREALHVHLTEIDGDHVTNPARHLRPYADGTPPSVDALTIYGPHNRVLADNAVHGTVLIVAAAYDTAPVPVPGNWHGFPITPALLQWTLLDARGRAVIPLNTVVDFRRFEPRQQSFWKVYAGGTYQNFPVFDHHFFWRRPGRYLFRLTRTPLDTRSLPNGSYEVRVVASDLCGNRGMLTEQVRIANS